MSLIGHWRAPKRHHPIAEELVDRTAVVQNRRRDRFQVLGEHGHHAAAELFGDAGEAGDIGEHYCQRLLVPAGASLDALGDQCADELSRHVLLERRQPSAHLHQDAREVVELAQRRGEPDDPIEVEVFDVLELAGNA